MPNQHALENWNAVDLLFPDGRVQTIVSGNEFSNHSAAHERRRVVAKQQRMFVQKCLYRLVNICDIDPAASIGRDSFAEPIWARKKVFARRNPPRTSADCIE